ncbi:MAG TPA: MFS transporter [Burkholderiales bacterium]|nr:MFS transporter [Burkholderiales bacterium]
MTFQRGAAATVSLVVLSQVVHFLTYSGLALLLPFIRQDLGITFAQAGVLSAVATSTYALAQIPAGYLSDRYGPKRLFFGGLLGWSLLAAALALAFSYWAALVTLAAAGACRALLFAPGIALVASWFPPQRRATAMSLFLVGSFVGTIVLALSAPRLSAWFGWRPAFAVYALLGVATALAFHYAAAENPDARPARRIGLGDALDVLKHRVAWLCNALQFIRFSAVTGFNFWLPSLLVSDRGFSLEQAGLVVGLSAACAAAANPLGAYISDRLGKPPLVIGVSLAIVACMSSLLVSVTSTPLLLAVVALHSVFMTVYFGPLFSVAVDALGSRRAGLATGVGNLFANVGALISAFALGVIKDATGSFAAGFYAMSALCAVGVALAFALSRMRTASADEALPRIGENWSTT